MMAQNSGAGQSTTTNNGNSSSNKTNSIPATQTNGASSAGDGGGGNHHHYLTVSSAASIGSNAKNLVRNNSVATLNQIYQHHNSIPARNRILSTAKSLQQPSIDFTGTLEGAINDTSAAPVSVFVATAASNNNISSSFHWSSSGSAMLQQQQQQQQQSPLHHHHNVRQVSAGSSYHQPALEVGSGRKSAPASRNSLNASQNRQSSVLGPSGQRADPTIMTHSSAQIGFQVSHHKKSSSPASASASTSAYLVHPSVRIINVARRHKRQNQQQHQRHLQQPEAANSTPATGPITPSWLSAALTTSSGETVNFTNSASGGSFRLSTTGWSSDSTNSSVSRDSSVSPSPGSGASSLGASPLHSSPVAQQLLPMVAAQVSTSTSAITSDTTATTTSTSTTTTSNAATKSSSSPASKTLAALDRAPMTQPASPSFSRQLSATFGSIGSGSSKLAVQSSSSSASGSPRRRILPSQPMRAASVNVPAPLDTSPSRSSNMTSIVNSGSEPPQNEQQQQQLIKPSSSFKRRKLPQIPTVASMQQPSWSAQVQARRAAAGSSANNKSQSSSSSTASDNSNASPLLHHRQLHSSAQQAGRVQSFPAPNSGHMMGDNQHIMGQQRHLGSRQLTPPAYQFQASSLSNNSSSKPTMRSKLSASSSSSNASTTNRSPTYLITPPNQSAVATPSTSGVMSRYFTFDHTSDQSAATAATATSSTTMNNSTTNFACYSPGGSRADTNASALSSGLTGSSFQSSLPVESAEVGGVNQHDNNGSEQSQLLHTSASGSAGRGRRLSSCGSGLRANFLMNKQHAISEFTPPRSLESSASRGSGEWQLAIGPTLNQSANFQQQLQVHSGGGKNLQIASQPDIVDAYNGSMVANWRDVSPTAMYMAKIHSLQDSMMTSTTTSTMTTTTISTAPATVTTLTGSSNELATTTTSRLSTNLVTCSSRADTNIGAGLSGSGTSATPIASISTSNLTGKLQAALGSIRSGLPSTRVVGRRPSGSMAGLPPRAASATETLPPNEQTLFGAGSCNLAGLAASAKLNAHSMIAVASPSIATTQSSSNQLASGPMRCHQYQAGSNQSAAARQLTPHLGAPGISTARSVDVYHCNDSGYELDGPQLLGLAPSTATTATRYSSTMDTQLNQKLLHNSSCTTNTGISATNNPNNNSLAIPVRARQPSDVSTASMPVGAFATQRSSSILSTNSSTGALADPKPQRSLARPEIGQTGEAVLDATTGTISRKFGAWANCIAHTSGAFATGTAGRRARSASQLEGAGPEQGTQPTTVSVVRHHRGRGHRRRNSSSSSGSAGSDSSTSSGARGGPSSPGEGGPVQPSSSLLTASFASSNDDSSSVSSRPASPTVAGSKRRLVARSQRRRTPQSGGVGAQLVDPQRRCRSASGNEPADLTSSSRRHRSQRRASRQAETLKGLASSGQVDGNDAVKPDQLTIGDRLKLAERSASKLFRKVELSPQRLLASGKQNSSDSAASQHKQHQHQQQQQQQQHQQHQHQHQRPTTQTKSGPDRDRSSAMLAIAPTGGGESHEFADDEQGDDLSLFLRSFDLQQQQKLDSRNNTKADLSNNPVNCLNNGGSNSQQWPAMGSERRRRSSELRAKSALGSGSATASQAAKVLRRAMTFRSLVKNLSRRASSLGQHGGVNGDDTLLVEGNKPSSGCAHLLSVASADARNRRSADNLELNQEQSTLTPTHSDAGSVRRRAARLFRRSKHSKNSKPSMGTGSKSVSTENEHQELQKSGFSGSFNYENCPPNQRSQNPGSQPNDSNNNKKQLTRMKSGKYTRP